MFEMFQMTQDKHKSKVWVIETIVTYCQILEHRIDRLQITQKFATKFQAIDFHSNFSCIILIEKQPPQIEQILALE